LLESFTQSLAQVSNARARFSGRCFDQTFGILGSNYFRGPGGTFDASLATPEQFRSPGAPFGAWLGIRYRWERPA